VLLFPHQNAGQEFDIKINAGQKFDLKTANRSSENVAHIQYVETTVTHQNLIQEEIKSRLNSDNACYHSAQNLLSPCLLPANVKFKIYKTTVLPVVL
jgi:hypothetical protein